MKIGLMGGTFNPIHNAHLRIAEESLVSCGLEQVIFIPAADPPHKKLSDGVTFDSRCEMVRLAVKGYPSFELSRLEGDRRGKSYSIDTIRIFQEKLPDSELFFIIGGDSFLEIGLWRCYADIFRSCSLIVFERPGCMINDPYADLPDDIKEEFRYDDASRRLQHQSGHFVQFAAHKLLDISSTEIRRLTADGKSIEALVPPEVAAYISKQRIYST